MGVSDLSGPETHRYCHISQMHSDQRIPNVVPQPKAGGSFATAAYKAFEHPVAVEHIQAAAGMDSGKCRRNNSRSRPQNFLLTNSYDCTTLILRHRLVLAALKTLLLSSLFARFQQQKLI